MAYQDKVKIWMEHPDLDPKLKAELKTMDAKALEDAFYTDVQFQTAGMRGLMGVGTNRINIHTIRKATMGFINYLLKKTDHPKVAISYDNRHDSRTYAYDCAALFATYGITSYVAKELKPTPELSFMVRHYHCDGGVMITASHNPKEYNGYKLYDENGCQLIPELADKVIKEIALLDDILKIKPDDKDHSALINIVDEDVDEAYFNAVLSIQRHPEVKKDFKIAFSPEHGTSYLPVMTCLKKAGYDIEVVKEQAFPDPDFSNTKTPNPEEKGAYEGVLALAEKIDAALILVCDPDGDRMGVGIKHNGQYQIFNGNQTGALLLEYILHCAKESNELTAKDTMFNTIVTGDIGEAVASSYGIKTEKTLTGFKYIGDKVAKYEKDDSKHYIFGYEESYGSLIAPFVRDKDATQACLLLAEECAYYRQQNMDLQDVLDMIYQKTGAYYDTQFSIALPGADGALKLKALMEKLRKEPLKAVEDNPVVKIEDYLNAKTTYPDGQEEALNGFDRSDVLKYYLKDGSYIAIRPSGTEPKCKIYFSIKDLDLKKAQAKGERYRAYMSELLR